MRIFVAFLLLLILPNFAHAQGTQIQRADIIDIGLYQSEKVRSTDAPGTAMGRVDVTENVKHLQTTTTIPARLETEFGFRYRIVGKPNHASVTLKFVTRYPPPGPRNPKTGNTILRGEFSSTHKIGETLWRTYRFDEEWEIVPGTWTLEVWDGDRKLAGESFTVVKP